MRIDKKIISNLTLCYCIAPVTWKGQQHFIVASEKEHACLLFDQYGSIVDTIWEQPGGTMSATQVPGADGVFLATHRFYSPNNSKEASIVLSKYQEGHWQTRTVVALPHVHRFDILVRDGMQYLLACCLKRDYEYKDDWRFPGYVLAGKLKENWMDGPEGHMVDLSVIKDNMLKNHGYSRHMHNGIMTGIVSSDEGVFRFTPPAAKQTQWTIEQLITDPVSDAVFVDLDSCGEEELLTIAPFHGDTMSVYKKAARGYHKVFEYPEKLAFAHAICGATLCGKPSAVVGYRKGARDLLLITFEGGGYNVTILDHDVGSANVMHCMVDGKDVLVSANRGINEVAYYTLME